MDLDEHIALDSMKNAQQNSGLFNLAADLSRVSAAASQAGIDIGRREGKAARDALSAILHAYDKALMEHPTTMNVALPTYLVAALESARKVVA